MFHFGARSLIHEYRRLQYARPAVADTRIAAGNWRGSAGRRACRDIYASVFARFRGASLGEVEAAAPTVR